jgi:hypothetical protein
MFLNVTRSDIRVVDVFGEPIHIRDGPVLGEPWGSETACRQS